MATLAENHKRNVDYRKNKALKSLRAIMSPLWHPEDFLDYERHAEAQQLAESRLLGQENVESGKAWKT